MNDETLNSIVNWVQALDTKQATYYTGATLAALIAFIVVPELVNWYFLWSVKKDVRSLKSHVLRIEDQLNRKNIEPVLTVIPNPESEKKDFFPLQH